MAHPRRREARRAATRRACTRRYFVDFAVAFSIETASDSV
jgi:hypothetical protein